MNNTVTDAYQEYLKTRREHVPAELEIRPVLTERDTRVILDLMHITEKSLGAADMQKVNIVKAKIESALTTARDTRP